MLGISDGIVAQFPVFAGMLFSAINPPVIELRVVSLPPTISSDRRRLDAGSHGLRLGERERVVQVQFAVAGDQLAPVEHGQRVVHPAGVVVRGEGAGRDGDVQLGRSLAQGGDEIAVERLRRPRRGGRLVEEPHQGTLGRQQHPGTFGLRRAPSSRIFSALAIGSATGSNCASAIRTVTTSCCDDRQCCLPWSFHPASPPGTTAFPLSAGSHTHSGPASTFW